MPKLLAWTDKVEQDGVLLGGGFQHVSPYAPEIKDEDKEEPEAEGAVGVDLAGFGELELEEYAGKEGQQGG